MKNYDLLKVVATQLNGLQYPLYPERYDYNGVSLIDYCKRNGIVIVCGSSDGLMELYGAIKAEYGCWDGGTICFNERGEHADANDYFPVTAIWAKDDISWQYEFEPKHEEFTIHEDADIYCKGIVFFVDDLKRKAAEKQCEFCREVNGEIISKCFPLQETAGFKKDRYYSTMIMKHKSEEKAGIVITTNGTNGVYFDIDYCPFCGRKL